MNLINKYRQQAKDLLLPALRKYVNGYEEKNLVCAYDYEETINLVSALFEKIDQYRSFKLELEHEQCHSCYFWQCAGVLGSYCTQGIKNTEGNCLVYESNTPE